MAKTTTKKPASAPAEADSEKEVRKPAQEAQEAAQTGKKDEGTVTLSRAELDALIASAVASAMAKNGPQIVQVAPSEDPVVLLYLGGIMPGTTVALGELGNIYRDGGTLTVSKENFFSKLNGTAEFMLRTRQLIAVSGLTDEERERYGVLYKENELLNEKTYGRLLTYPVDELKVIYSALCPEHKAIVAKAFRTAIDAEDVRVTREKLNALAKIDREAGIENSVFRVMTDQFAPDTED